MTTPTALPDLATTLRRKRATPTGQVTAETTTSTAQAPVRTPDKESETPSPAKASRPVERREYLRQITYSLPRDLHRRGKDRAAERGETLTAFLLNAINTHHERILDGHETPQEVTGGLFTIPQAARPTVSKVQTSIRITDSQTAAITALCKKTGLDRGEVFAAALRLELR
ncbi:ribbon-helix-helix CopG family protein [Antricoccus suffuscus]|uniref:Ribbon-helix-helix CopG family protein n=1 Tax=Antricoccus suffuscus TaxID=1629062 RepID=A0A2T0ZTL6_9ACTN|nr:ribbon-helix-helix protein, CopG family [Antricoccus suffuscus]PRZ39663.1 ribbon-helix-helix CopG family protein [Antricoccus suffuscus]